MADQLVFGPTLRDGLRRRRNAYLIRLTRWERTTATGEAVVQIRRRFAGSASAPDEAPFSSPERTDIEKRYGDCVTSYGDWESLRIIRNELNLNRLVAWLVWLKEESATDPKIVGSAKDPFRTALEEGANPFFGVLPMTVHLPALEAHVGFGGIFCALRRCGANLPGQTIATVFQAMAGVQTLKIRPQSRFQSDELEAVLPVERLGNELEELVRAFEKDQKPRAPSLENESNLASKISTVMLEGRSAHDVLSALGQTFATDEDVAAAVDAAWGDAANRLLFDLSGVLSTRAISELLDWLAKVHAGLKAQAANRGGGTTSPPPSGWEPPTRSGWEQPPVGGWERPPISGWEPPPRSGRDLPSAVPDRLPGWHRAVRTIAAIAALEQLNRRSLQDGIQDFVKLVLVNFGWSEDVVRQWLDYGVTRSGFPLRAAAMLEYPGVYAAHIHGLDEFQFPDYTPLGARWCANVLIPSTIAHILGLKDTADFHTTDHLRFVHLFDAGRLMTAPEVLPPQIRPFFEAALRRFKFWIDDAHSKSEEEMTFWSENHQVLFASCEYLAGQRWPDLDFYHGDVDGATHDGAWHRERAAKRLHRWLDDRMKLGFSEWNAPGYYNEDLPPLLNIIDFCQDPDLVAKALTVTDLIVFDLARFTCQGNFGVTAGRVYLEHKRVAWDQSIGDFIELLFGTRGDMLSPNETTAIAMATSSYLDKVPDALLAIGRDRPPTFTDDSRVSTELSEREGAGADAADIIFWWGIAGYYTRGTYDDTVRWVDRWHLSDTGPFKAILLTGDDVWESMGVALLGFGVSAVVLKIGTFLPFPVNIVFIAASVPGIVRGFLDIILAGVDLVLEFAEDVWDTVIELFGGDTDDDDAPRLSRPAVLEILKRLLIEFNAGSLLTTACLRTFRTPDVMLSSAVHHRPGEIAFQKQTSIAVIGQNASVWTTKPVGDADTAAALLRGTTNLVVNTPGTWVKTIAFPWAVRPYDNIAEVALPFVKDAILDGGHDGPNWWTGSATLPDVWQVDNVAIQLYKPTDPQKGLSKKITHAWFAKDAFDELRWEPSAGGMWVMGRRDRRFPPENPRNPADPTLSDDNRNRKVKDEALGKGSGYVALFSANGFSWSGGTFKDRELEAEGHENIFVTVVGDQAMFTNFDLFVQAIVNCGISASVSDMACSLRIPSGPDRGGQGKHFDVTWGAAKVDGIAISTFEWPRFENRYVHGRKAGRVDATERQWRIVVPHPTRQGAALELAHDCEHPERRSYNQQARGTRLKRPARVGTGGG